MIINSLDFSNTAQVLAGDLDKTQLPRLTSVVRAFDGVLHYRLVGKRNAAGRAALEVAFSGRVLLTCQRCQQAMVFDMDEFIDFVWFSDEVSAEAAEHEGDVDALVMSPEFNALQMLEDEMLLSIPHIPRHQQCAAEYDKVLEKYAPEPKVNPFAVLAQLKKPTH